MFLRLIRSARIELPHTTAIGIDDFSFRKGRDYGSLIYDLNTHHPPAILPGRTSELVEAWLKSRPHIETISRDGSKTYREAITQVSDGWHMIKNVKETLLKWLAQKLPAQIEWHSIQDEKVMKLPEEQPIDEPKWQLIQQVQHDYNEGIRITHLAKKVQSQSRDDLSLFEATIPARKSEAQNETGSSQVTTYIPHPSPKK